MVREEKKSESQIMKEWNSSITAGCSKVRCREQSVTGHLTGFYRIALILFKAMADFLMYVQEAIVADSSHKLSACRAVP